MKVRILVWSILLVILLSGCGQRLVDFTIISTKNIDLSRANTFERAKSRVTGVDMVHWIIFIPTGVPNMEEAIDRAIESVPGAIALVDGVLRSKFWWIPYLYGQQSFIIEGTPLIDPSLASAWTEGQFMVTIMDKNGKVLETKSVTEEEYKLLHCKFTKGPS